MSTDLYWIAKAVVACIAAVLLVWHMLERWETINSTAQRMRFTALLGYALLQTYGSTEQLGQNASIEPRNIGGGVIAVYLVFTVIASMREWRRTHDPASDDQL